jgi:hypothetical protein
VLARTRLKTDATTAPAAAERVSPPLADNAGAAWQKRKPKTA